METLKLVVALGNVGKKYENTRHNIAWKVFEKLSFSGELKWKKKFQGLYENYNLSGRKISFLMPTTMMNNSGLSVQALAHFFHISPEEMLVVHDELDHPFGTFSLRKNGGMAGHNGLQSICSSLDSKAFHRLRVGISRPVSSGDISHWVLSPFNWP